MINVRLKTLKAAALIVVLGSMFQVTPNLGLNWSFDSEAVLSGCVEEITTGTKGKCHAPPRVNVRIQINVGMPGHRDPRFHKKEGRERGGGRGSQVPKTSNRRICSRYEVEMSNAARKVNVLRAEQVLKLHPNRSLSG